MKRSRLLAASAGMALATAIGFGEAAHATLPADHANSALKARHSDAVLKVRRHVQALKEAQVHAVEAIAAATHDQRRNSRHPWWEASLSPGRVPKPETGGGVVQAQASGTAPNVAATADTPPQQTAAGVLTRQGVLVMEPSIEYAHTDVNRFVVGGVAILDTVLVGSIEASQADRDSVTASLGMRYGVTDRIEAEVRIPYMYRNDETTNTVVSTNNVDSTTSLDSHGLGDIEAALHWQINDGSGDWPFFVANIRAKSTTGTGPFDTARDARGIERELATGSGFWGVEPSITVIAPSDPAVFFVNLGYLWNIERDVDRAVGNRVIQEVDPGDAVRLGFGMGLALNEKVSFSVGYQHDWIFGTETRFNDATFKSEALSVGAMNFGVNWQMTDVAALNVSVGVGVTEDAPDVRLMARMPIAFDLFGK